MTLSRKRSIRVLTGLVVLLTALLVVPSWAQEDEEESTVLGEVQAAEEDEDGNALSVYVYDPDWGDVLVSSSGKGAEVLQLVGQTVLLTGDMREQDGTDFDWVIVVHQYEVVGD